MGLSFGSNINALIVQNALNVHTKNVSRASERLTTGLRINRPSDDIAGYVKVVGYDSQIRGIDAAQQNINTGIGILDTMDTALNIVRDNVASIREEVVAAGVPGYDADGGQTKIDQLVKNL